MSNTSNLIPSPFSRDMQEDWNDFAQSESNEPKLFTKILLIIIVSAMVMVFFGNVNCGLKRCINR